MKLLLPRPVALAAPFLLVLTLGARATDSAPQHAPPFALAPPEATLLFDEPGDGRLWACGASYKASFGAEGATYYPRLGARAPRNLPLSLSPASVTVGGEPLAFAREPQRARTGDRVELDRGAFVEAYELEADSLEQLFVFPSLPHAGEIVVRIPTATELEPAETAAAIEFRGEVGRVTYGRAVAVDAAGRRAPAPTRVEDGAIEIRVPAGFVAAAQFPLTIDPVVSSFSIDSTIWNASDADVAWDPFHLAWLAVFEMHFSASDTDVYARALNVNGEQVALAVIDGTAASWERPRVANNGAAHRFLVVAERTSTNPNAVVARGVRPNGAILTMDPQFDFVGGAQGHKRAPVVGGDPHATAPSYYCVAFQHEVSPGDTRIAYCMVNPADGIEGGTHYVPNAPGTTDSQPAISKSNDARAWHIVWRREDPLYRGDVYGALVAWEGTLYDGPFGITAFGIANDANPTVASPQLGTERTIVALQRNSLASSNYAVMVVPLDGSTVGPQTDVSVLEGSGQQGVAQIEPCIDGDGRHFLLAYAEFDTFTAGYHVFATDLHLAGDRVGVSQAHLHLPSAGDAQRLPRVVSRRGELTSHSRYLVSHQLNWTGFQLIAGNLFDVVPGGIYVATCPGDGSAGACPCGNSGATGNGCASSVNASGASLAAAGLASPILDGLVLTASGMPNSTCLLFSGTTSTAPAPFGDGLRCVGGTVVRIVARTVTGGSFTYPGPTDSTLTEGGAVPDHGGQRTYQVWYRNSVAFCTSSTFNLTNAVRVDWAQ